MNQAIKTTELEYVYPDGTAALSGVDFEAGRGEKVAVLGPNGSGKSTLFYQFNGLLSPTAGMIWIFGEPIDQKNVDLIRKRVGLVFQNPDDQLFEPTVSEDIAFGPKNLKLDPMEIKERVAYVLRRFDIEDLAGKNPANLSEGQKKKVAIAGIVVMEPDVLVLDEPTSGLDTRGIADTMDILEELNDEGKTIVISTHDSDLAASWADRVYILNRGKVKSCGAPGHIFADEKLLSEAGLKHPVIVQTFREFRARGISKGEVPLTVLELIGSVDAEVLNIRCAIAGCDVKAGDEVGLEMRGGMLYAHKHPAGVRGKVLFGGIEGEDIAVKDVTGDLKQLAGGITIVGVPGIVEGGTRSVDVEEVRAILEKNRYQKTGAMGTSAKVLVKRMGIRCDFDIDVVQSGVLAALRGLDVIIFASGRMAQRVKEKVSERGVGHNFITL